MPNRIDRDNIEFYLKEVAKRYNKKTKGKMPAEITLVGGAALILNYGFREMTTDIDAIIDAASSMKDAIAEVSNDYSLPLGWLNDDFRKTASFSTKLRNVSEYYKTYANCVEFRIVSGKYLLAMKLVSGRPYKHDRSDVVGIIKEERIRGNNYSYDEILSAIEELYGSQLELPDETRAFLSAVLAEQDLETLEEQVQDRELHVRDTLKEFEQDYPKVASSSNILEIIDRLLAEENDIP